MEARPPILHTCMDFPASDPISLEIGMGLIAMACEKDTGLIATASRLRQEIQSQRGAAFPLVRIRDNSTLGARGYLVRINGFEVACGILGEDEGKDVLVDVVKAVIAEHVEQLASLANR